MREEERVEEEEEEAAPEDPPAISTIALAIGLAAAETRVPRGPGIKAGSINIDCF